MLLETCGCLAGAMERTPLQKGRLSDGPVGDLLCMHKRVKVVCPIIHNDTTGPVSCSNAALGKNTVLTGVTLASTACDLLPRFGANIGNDRTRNGCAVCKYMVCVF